MGWTGVQLTRQWDVRNAGKTTPKSRHCPTEVWAGTDTNNKQSDCYCPMELGASVPPPLSCFDFLLSGMSCDILTLILKLTLTYRNKEETKGDLGMS